MTNTPRFPFSTAAALCLAAATSLWAAPCAAARVTPELVVAMPSSYGSDFSFGGPLVQGADGQIYFTDYRSSTSDCGAITAVDPVAKISRSLPVDAVGCQPSRALALDADGDLWGSAYGIQQQTRGSLFRIAPHGVPTAVHVFPWEGDRSGSLVPAPWTNKRVMLAQFPFRNLIDAYAPPDYEPVPFATSEAPPDMMIQRWDASADSALYGLLLTNVDVPNAMTVFKKLEESGTLSTLGEVDRCGENITPDLTAGRDGNFYLNCPFGGPARAGNIIRLSPTGAKTTIHIFGGNGQRGSGPKGGVIHASDGWLYGSTAYGGSRSRGVIFRLRPDGSDYQVLFYFTGGKLGEHPDSRFVQASDGMVYGRSTRNGIPVIFRFALPR